MIAQTLALLSTALGLLFWHLKRRAEAASDPVEQNRKRYEQIDNDLVDATKGDSLDCAAHAGADLDELERLQRSRGDQRGPNGGVREVK